MAVVPVLRTRRWRWALRAAELDLRHGAVTERRTIVPISRVQHVELRRTLAGRLTDTVALVVHTAAGATTIPALSERDAVDVRDRIADRAQRPDDL